MGRPKAASRLCIRVCLAHTENGEKLCVRNVCVPHGGAAAARRSAAACPSAGRRAAGPSLGTSTRRGGVAMAKTLAETYDLQETEDFVPWEKRPEIRDEDVFAALPE